MKYQIVEYVGDYPIESQEYWDYDFETIESAEEAALEVAKNILDNEKYSEEAENYAYQVYISEVIDGDLTEVLEVVLLTGDNFSPELFVKKKMKEDK